MEIISNCTQDVIDRAAKALIEGNLVAFPTETVYGLGADATNERAVSRLYTAKGRPTGHPLIVHIESIDLLDEWAREIPEFALKLAIEFWPGPMTLILKRKELAKDFITGGQDNVGLRVPNHLVAHSLISKFKSLGGLGIAAPSANRYGAVSPTTADAVADELEDFLHDDDLILNGGFSKIGVESSIIDCTKEFPVVLRPGAITTEMIEMISILKVQLGFETIEIKAPGLLRSHYSPKAKVVIGNHTESGNGFIALANLPTPNGAIRLASPKDIEEYAKIFYIALREGDKKGLKIITVAQPSGPGLAEAIRDRINKAASVNVFQHRH